jgi:phosphoglycerol transferase MdoB-like AlkP superfamily enzyme
LVKSVTASVALSQCVSDRFARVRFASTRVAIFRPARIAILRLATIGQFLASHDQQEPLCLIVSSWSPHIPWPENDGYNRAQVALPPGSVDTPEARAARTRYYSDVTQLDSQLGSCLDSLARYGFADNLLFVYASDHGAQ